MPVLPAPAAPEGSQCHCHCCRLPYFWRLPHLQGPRVGSGGGKRVTVELGLLPGTASARGPASRYNSVTLSSSLSLYEGRCTATPLSDPTEW